MQKKTDKIQCAFIIKAQRKLRIESLYFNKINIYQQNIANIILNAGKPKIFPLKSGMRQGCLPSLLLFNTVLEFLARTIEQDKETKLT
jgi:hypothetical protein